MSSVSSGTGELPGQGGQPGQGILKAQADDSACAESKPDNDQTRTLGKTPVYFKLRESGTNE